MAYASVTTVLNRLTKKGWLKCCKQNKAFSWEPLVSREQTNTLRACEQLQQFLAISNPNMVASLVDSLDTTSLERLELIAANLQAIRHQREIK